MNDENLIPTSQRSNTAEWCLSLYSEDDKQMQVFITDITEFWTALSLFHVKQHFK